jgi:hypothetical protein
LQRSQPNTHFIIIDVDHPQSDLFGCVVVSIPIENNSFDIMCAINRHNGYFMEINVNTMDEVYDVIQMCQSILPYQPNNVELDYVRVPNNYLDNWWIPNYLRNINLNPQNQMH